MKKKRIIFTVTNDLTYDQRMQRICSSISKVGYDVLLVGRKTRKSIPLDSWPFEQVRLNAFVNKGPLFYILYNLRLLIFLLSSRFDAVCAIDLDTILPCYFASKFKNSKRVYDAHELFTEQKEIVTRPTIHKIWLAIEKFAVPKFKWGYTVNDFIVQELHKRYGVSYGVVRNLPALTPLDDDGVSQDKFIIYQGAVNEGRSFETLVPAMRHVDAQLIVCGEGNYFDRLKQLVQHYNVADQVILRGYVLPNELKKLTPQAYAAVTIFESTGLNQYYSLSNRFFDYIMAGVPQLCVNYPEYKRINDKFKIAYMIDDTSERSIAAGLNELLNNDELQAALKRNCRTAREELCWENEEKGLITFWNKLLPLE